MLIFLYLYVKYPFYLRSKLQNVSLGYKIEYVILDLKMVRELTMTKELTMTWEFLISQEHLIKLGISLFIFFIFLLFRRIFSKYIMKFLVKLGHKFQSKFLPNLISSFDRPLQWLFIFIGLYVSLVYYPYIDHTTPIIIKWLKSIFIILFSWGLVNLTSTSSNLFLFIKEKTNIKLDEILIPFLSRAFQFIIIAIAFSIILQEFNYHIGGLITGLGIGGLAISLAAKDALANLFGGVIIVTEKPFTIDDWIMTPSVEGTVEDISFRSTKVRTFDQGLVIVPNATLANEAITNWSEMGKRRIYFNLRLTYSTPLETIKKVAKRIEAILQHHQEIHQETIIVRVNEFEENGVDIMIYCFTKTIDWEEHLAIHEDINLQILNILEEKQAQIAIPTQKLYVKNDETLPIDE